MSNIPTGTTLNGYPITYWNRQTVADGDEMSLYTIIPICSAINDNIKSIETMQAATDVIDVFGTFAEFSANSGTLTAEGYLTDKDIIKVLEDETKSASQTYYQYSITGEDWTYIGSLDPYYSKSEIDVITANIETEISTNYLKADNVHEGNNITITKTTSDDGPTITIGTKDDVTFNKVSSTDFSGTNISGGNKTATIENVITSAEGGSAASAWIVANKNNYVKYTDSTLKIGDTANLGVTGAATALGKYASASNYSFALSFGANNTQKIYASDKGFAVGDTNSASFNSFIIGHNNLALGSNEASNKFIIGVGNTIVNTVTNSYIIGANNTNDQPGLIILGNDAKQNHNLGDILAVGNGGSDDALLLNTNSLYVHPKYDTFNQLTAGVKISNDGIYFRNHTKIYPSIELFGKEIFTTTREDMSLDSIFFNTLLLNGTELFNNKFGAYITKEVSLAHTNTIKIFSTNIHYDFRIGVPMEYTVILKGFNPYNGLTQNQIDSGIRNLHYITTNSTGVSWDSETDTGTYITSASYIKQANQPAASVQTWCLWINNMSTDQYIDCTIDRANKYLIMIKGGFGGNN